LIAPTLRPIDSARDITRPDPSAQAIDRKTLLPKPVPPITDHKPQEQALQPESSAS
jgi:hypothetical protein